jgi:hypothetical protein
MLTFLRKIRKSLVDTGSTRKYLLYAIGEIGLVVIGILIALQINTWNVERLNSIEEKRILLSVTQKVEFNRFQHAMGSTRYKEVIAGAESLASHISSKEANIPNEEIIKDLHDLTHRFLMGASNATHLYDELIGSGQMGLITSEELRENITKLKVDMELLASYEILQTNFVDDHLIPYLNTKIDRMSVAAIGSRFDSSLFNNKSLFMNFELQEDRDLNLSFDGLLDDLEFSNLLFELLKKTSVLLPIYDRVEHNLNQIDYISTL